MSDDLSVVPGMKDEPTFAEPWQAQAFAMTVALHEGGAFRWAEWAEMLSVELETDADYWPAWMRALERMMAAKTDTGAEELDARKQAWRKAADATPHGKPITLTG